MIIILTTDRFFTESCTKALGAKNVVFIKSFIELRQRMTEKSDDVVLLDVATVEPFDLTKVKCNVVVLTGVPKFNEAVKLMRYGIRGYGNKMMHADNLIQAINSVKSGQVWMPPFIISRLITSLPNGEQNEQEEMPDLSDRETEVAKLIASGMTNKEIAEQMDITVRTVKAHLTSIFNKTGLRDRVALALKFRSGAA